MSERRWQPCFVARCNWFSYCCARRFGHAGPHRAFGPHMVTEWDDTGKVLRRLPPVSQAHEN